LKWIFGIFAVGIQTELNWLRMDSSIELQWWFGEHLDFTVRQIMLINLLSFDLPGNVSRIFFQEYLTFWKRSFYLYKITSLIIYEPGSIVSIGWIIRKSRFGPWWVQRFFSLLHANTDCRVGLIILAVFGERGEL
jgi:hypothetical protein